MAANKWTDLVLEPGHPHSGPPPALPPRCPPGKEERGWAALCSAEPLGGCLLPKNPNSWEGGKGPLRPSAGGGRTNTIKMNIVLKLKHLIGTFLKILESLLKKKEEQAAVCAFPRRIRGERHSLGTTLPPPN